MKKELTLADVNFLPQERLITEKEIFKEFREHIVLFNCTNRDDWQPLGYTGKLVATLYVGRREEMLVDSGRDLIDSYVESLWDKEIEFVSKSYYVFPEDEDDIYG
ncbi:MAG: hypothetical protein FWG64_03085 [Firmicutes bacterium]|nr:hypothetical protein [Bacillota bacterium]